MQHPREMINAYKIWTEYSKQRQQSENKEVGVKERAILEIFIAMKIRVVFFWVMAPCSDVVGYAHPEDGGGMALRNVGIPPPHYTLS
jgi:hypothetical protein